MSKHVYFLTNSTEGAFGKVELLKTFAEDVIFLSNLECTCQQVENATRRNTKRLEITKGRKYQKEEKPKVEKYQEAKNTERQNIQKGRNAKTENTERQKISEEVRYILRGFEKKFRWNILGV